MKIDSLKNSTIILNVTGCTWLEFDSWTTTGSYTDNGYTYDSGGYFKAYDYTTSKGTNVLMTEDGYEAMISTKSGKKKSLSKQKINVENLDYVQITSSYYIGSNYYGTVLLTGLKGY